ncbi:MAG TPA: DUF6159 family protein, partial [Kofleriaceae bacterium]|nr:DUF6159 family protein [Kofleriaceae bacterium]
KKGWSFMGAAFAMARENKKLLAPSLIQVLVSIMYWVAWIAVLIAIHPHWSNGTWAGVGAIATFGSFLIFYFFCGMTVNMIDVHLKGGKPSIGDGARDAGKNFVAIVFLALVSTVIEMFARAARDNDSIVGKIVAGIVEAIWTTLAFLLLPAIIIEDAGFGAAMKRVRALHKGNLLLIGIGEVGVRGVTGLIGFLWMMLVVGVIWVDVQVFSGWTALIFGVVVGGTMISLFVAFSTYIRMAYYTCLYLWAADVEKQGQSAPAPLPLAIALGHREAPRRAA